MERIQSDSATALIERLTAIDLLKSESPRHPYQLGFRGQADARWKLIPSAMRPGTRLGFYSEGYDFASSGDGADVLQMNAELGVVSQFAQMCDRVGLPAPGFHAIYRQSGLEIGMWGSVSVGGIGIAEWPKPEMVELLAVAQHHGVPTRLLDFSYSPKVALFFAAHDCVAHEVELRANGATELSVWCVNASVLRKDPSEFSVVEVPRATNPFLFAQRGLFILDRRIHESKERSGEYCLSNRIRQWTGGTANCCVAQYTLPFEESHAALEILRLEQVDRVHLMPTHDNVARHLNAIHCGRSDVELGQ